MLKVNREFKPSEIINEFYNFYNTVGKMPCVHIGTDSQIQKLPNNLKAFRFSTVACLHYNSREPDEKRISKLWAFSDMERASAFELNDNSKIMKKLFSDPFLRIKKSGMEEEEFEVIRNSLNSITESMGLKGFEKYDVLQPAKVNAQALTLRMISEAARTLAAANTLTGADNNKLTNGKFIPVNSIRIGVDINSQDQHLSNKSLNTVVGMVNGFGYANVDWKPNSMITYAADRLSK